MAKYVGAKLAQRFKG